MEANPGELAIFGTLAPAHPAQAQYYYTPGFSGFAYRSQYRFAFGGPRFQFSTQYRGFYAAPISPFYYSNYWVPPYGPGYGPGYGNPFFLPQPPFAGPILPFANNVPLDPEPGPARIPAPASAAQAVKGEFLVISPKGTSNQRVGEDGTLSPVVDRVASPPRACAARVRVRPVRGSPVRFLATRTFRIPTRRWRRIDR